MGANPTFSRIYPVNGDGALKGYSYGVKILDYDGLNDKLDRQQEMRSLKSAEKQQEEKKDDRGFALREGRYKIEEVETDEYPPRTWKVLIRYYVPEPPYYASAEAHAYYWGIISKYTEPFYVYCSPKNHTMPTVADVVNRKSPHFDEKYCYKIIADDGLVTIKREYVEMAEEEKLVENFNIDLDEVEDW